ncbi:ABC transporter ATP-binding protein [Micromonospora sp. DT228]|uniref:ABC transporter ATP-binding protein n=1 Tax=Micromonospora sp. DT228 TaxID=3393443 RepID=UPI003CF93387
MIDVQRLTKRFGAVTAVDELSFTVRPGIVTGFLGPNGAGKSTTMRMILGLDRPTSGRATVDGRPYGEIDRPARHVGAVLDANWVHPNRSARSHLRWIAAANAIPTSRVDAVLEQVGLTPVARRSVGAFSLGMRQRLGIAGALLGEPGVLILDEPANGLDPDGILWLRRLVRDYAAGGRTVLLSSHLLAEVAGTVDQIILIGKGRLIADQPIADFLAASGPAEVRARVDRPDHLHAALAKQNLPVRAETDDQGRPVLVVVGAATDEVGTLARAADCTVWELFTNRISLEEAFLKATDEAVEYRGPGATPHLIGEGTSR